MTLPTSTALLLVPDFSNLGIISEQNGKFYQLFPYPLILYTWSHSQPLLNYVHTCTYLLMFIHSSGESIDKQMSFTSETAANYNFPI